MRCFGAVVACGLAALLASAALADIAPRFHQRVVREGDRVAADIGYTAGRPLPLYLVSARRWPPDLACGRVCEPTERSAPTQLPFHRLRHVVWSRSRTAASFGVPRLRPGRYYLVVYCAGCVKGPRGSLITSSNTLRIIG